MRHGAAAAVLLLTLAACDRSAPTAAKVDTSAAAMAAAERKAVADTDAALREEHAAQGTNAEDDRFPR